MKYCSLCGDLTEQKIPDGDSKHRHVCGSCDEIHYQNPKIIAGCLPVIGNKVLLCKRAIEPRYGYWTLPAGFMENEESTKEAALRETWEEALAKVESPRLFTLFDLPHISQVYLFYLGDLLDETFAPGEESLEVGLFAEDEIPWGELAFPVITETLKLFFEDKKNNQQNFYRGSILRLPGEGFRYATEIDPALIP